jgi:hypothetical protein
VSSTGSASAVGEKRKKAKMSLASGTSSTTSVKGAITRVSLMHGAAVSTQLYFRQPKVVLSGSELHRLQAELTVIWKADFPLEANTHIDILSKVQAFTFCSIRHAPSVDRFGHTYSRKSVLRAPRCDDQFCTAVQTDVIGSYALVHTILDFCDRTYCFVRWVTSTYPGSRTLPSASNSCAKHFKKLKVTDTYSVINVLQIQAVVCFVPVFSAPGFVWLNTQPLGTVLRAYSQEETEFSLNKPSD